MAIEDRDWYRRDPPRGGRPGGSVFWMVVVVVLAAGVLLTPPVADRLGYTPPIRLFDRGKAGETRVSLLPGGPGIVIDRPELYAADDPWRAWLADEQTCPGGEDTDAPAQVQEQTMLCLLNFARRRQGLQPLTPIVVLDQSSGSKAVDIRRCGEFAHEPCGRPADAAVRQLGFRGGWGENIYIATGPLAAPRVAVDQWLNSPGHRENLFRPEARLTGIAMLADVTAHSSKGDRTIQDGVVWVNQFGT